MVLGENERGSSRSQDDSLGCCVKIRCQVSPGGGLGVDSERWPQLDNPPERTAYIGAAQPPPSETQVRSVTHRKRTAWNLWRKGSGTSHDTTMAKPAARLFRYPQAPVEGSIWAGMKALRAAQIDPST